MFLADSVNDLILLPPHSAESPDDFESVDTVLTFRSNTPEQCVVISIRDDDIVEQRESFYVTLEGPPGLDDRVSLGPTQQMVVIIDDDGEPKHSVWYGQVCM